MVVFELRLDIWFCVDFGILGSFVFSNVSVRFFRVFRWFYRDIRVKCDFRIILKAFRCVCLGVGVCT